VPEHRCAHDLRLRVGAGPDQVVFDQPPVEMRDLLEGYADLLPCAHARRHAVDLVSTLDHALDERPRLAHALDRLWGDLDGLGAAGDAHDVANGKAASA
jgi:hypothetical protein